MIWETYETYCDRIDGDRPDEDGDAIVWTELGGDMDMGSHCEEITITTKSALLLTEEVVDDALDDLDPAQRAEVVFNMLNSLDEHRAALALVEYVCAMQPGAQVWLAEQLLGLIANRARVADAGLEFARVQGRQETVQQAGSVAEEAHGHLARVLAVVAPRTFGAVLDRTSGYGE